jgi:hypothetical protein
MTVPISRPGDWYWQDATGRIYSSRRNAIISGADPDFQAFMSTYLGAIAPWPTDANGNQSAAALQMLLLTYGINQTVPGP